MDRYHLAHSPDCHFVPPSLSSFSHSACLSSLLLSSLHPSFALALQSSYQRTFDQEEHHQRACESDKQGSNPIPEGWGKKRSILCVTVPLSSRQVIPKTTRQGNHNSPNQKGKERQKLHCCLPLRQQIGLPP